MEKKIIICIGTDRLNSVRARLSLLLLDGEQVLLEHYHSVVLQAGDSLEDTRAQVEAHLALDSKASGIPLAPWPAIPDKEWRKVERVCEVFHE